MDARRAELALQGVKYLDRSDCAYLKAAEFLVDSIRLGVFPIVRDSELCKALGVFFKYPVIVSKKVDDYINNGIKEVSYRSHSGYAIDLRVAAQVSVEISCGHQLGGCVLAEGMQTFYTALIPTTDQEFAKTRRDFDVFFGFADEVFESLDSARKSA